MKARTNQLQAFAQLALTVSKRILPAHGHKFAPKTYTQPQLLACLLLKEHLRLDYRGAQDLLELSDGLREALSLRQAPDHSTLWWFAQHKVTPELLQQALAETVRLLTGQDSSPGGTAGGPPAGKKSARQVALDSTGLFLHHTSRYYEWRARRERGQRGWLKWAAALWTRPQLLLAQIVRPAPAGDFSDLVPLAAAAHGVLPFRQLVADGGYDSEANHRYCQEELRAESLIPAHNRRGSRARTPYRRKMQRVLGVRGTDRRGTERARRDYGQRWKAETLMSVLKRKWGECLSARRATMQQLQALLRGVVYNLHRLTVLGVFLLRAVVAARVTSKSYLLSFSTEQGALSYFCANLLDARRRNLLMDIKCRFGACNSPCAVAGYTERKPDVEKYGTLPTPVAVRAGV